MLKVLNNIFKNRNLLSIFISGLIFIIIFIISSTQYLVIFDKKFNDFYFLFNPIKINKDIVVVEIDDDTLIGQKDNKGNIINEGLGRFPFDRKYYAKVIDNLTDAGASVIALDVIFGEKSGNSKEGLYSDNLLSESIKKSGKVVLGLWRNGKGKLEYPYYKFGDYIISSGFYSPIINKRTDTVYSFYPFYYFNDKLTNHFTIAILKAFYKDIYKNDNYLKNKYSFDNDKIILNDKIGFIQSGKPNNEVLINYSNSNRFYSKSFLDIYNGNFNYENIKNKIVIIGATAKGIKDIFNTPLGTEYGVYTHVNILNTILTKNGIKYFNERLEWFFIFLLIIVSVYFNISRSSFVLIFSNISLISFLILFVLFVSPITNTLLNYSIELFLALILSLTISNIVKYLIENKNKAKLNKALSEYVSVDVAKEILSGDGKINLDGENKNIAIFFSDIEGFTSISEQFSPEELVSFLREYLSDMSDIIMDEKGFINKYEGDAIMALWGVFGDDTNKSTNICLSALEQQKKLKELNKLWSKRGFSEIKARIGMHIGDAIIGNIGSEGRKMEFTALGDSVNLASRLEGVNKFYGTYICASENIYELEKNNFEFRYLDKIKVKGKEVPIKIYELLGFKGEVSDDILEIRELFEKAITLYLNRDFIKARTSFRKLVKMGDNAGKMYLDMCEIHIKNPPLEDWDGVATMTGK